MYVRIKTTPNSPRCSVQIVESKRDGGKVRQKIVRYVGIAMNEDELEKLKALAEEIRSKMEEESRGSSLFDHLPAQRGRPRAKRLEDVLPPDKVALNEVVEQKRIIEGIHEIAGDLYDKLGFDRILSRGSSHTLKEMVLMRLAYPSSKRAACKHLDDQFGRELNPHRVYRMLDQLEAMIPKMQKKVRDATLRLLPEGINMLLFDVTTLYFESVEADELRQFGYSKDQKYHCTQVVLALATTGEGLPVGYELFEGNLAEVKTLQQCLASWKAQGLKINSVCMVADRALFAQENLKILDQENISYVVAAPLRKLSKEFKDQILNEEGYRLATLENGVTWVKELEYQGKRLIVSYSPTREQKDISDRQRLLDKLTKKIGTKGAMKKLVSNQGYLKYVKENTKSTCQINKERVAQDAQWDGHHGVLTNAREEDALTILQRYHRLWIIEESFRINKHTLKMRPIYHHKPERIRAHIALCYLSFALMRHLQYRIGLTQEKMSPQQIINALNSVQASILVHKRTGDLYRLPGNMMKDARTIYQAFGVKRSQDAEIYLP